MIIYTLRRPCKVLEIERWVEEEPRKPFVCYVCSVSDQQLADSFSSISTLAIGSPPLPLLNLLHFFTSSYVLNFWQENQSIKNIARITKLPYRAKKSFGRFAWFWFRAGKSKSLIRWNRQKKKQKSWICFAIRLLPKLPISTYWVLSWQKIPQHTFKRQLSFTVELLNHMGLYLDNLGLFCSHHPPQFPLFWRNI